MKKKQQIYLFEWNNKLYHKKDCDELFICYYFGKETMRYDGAVYVSDGL